jgi:hypothetical protein
VKQPKLKRRTTMLFNAPSPRGSNNAQLFLNSKGELLDRTGAYWGKSQIAKLPKLARDELPDNLRAPAPANGSAHGNEREAEERLTKLRRELEDLIGERGLDLLDESKGQILAVLQKHCGDATRARRGSATDNARRHRVAHDEPDHEGLVQFLRSKGLDEQSIAHVLAIAREEAEPEADGKDRLPANALHGGYGGRLTGASRDHDDFAERFPEAAKIGSVYGTSQFDQDQHDRRSARDRRQQAHDSVPGSEAERRLAKKFPGIERIGVGEWPKRR